jgi:2-haloacid dehalogenase
VSAPIRAVILDAYGTLLDVHAAMQRQADHLPPDWERISADWRIKQLEYTWIDTLTGHHRRDFWQITQDALAFVAVRHRITDPAVLETLLEAYRRLPAYPDALPVLTTLRERGLRTAILSNGEPAMLHDAITAARLAPLLDAVLSVEDVGAFKPDRRVYALAEDRFSLPVGQMAFVSSNAWDAQAAAAAGFQVFWCNRTAQPDEYGLRAAATEMPGLSALPLLLA